MQERIKVLHNLIKFSRPIENISLELKKFPWDYEGEAYIVTKNDIQIILERFIKKEFDLNKLEDWANLIECREDIEFEEKYSEFLIDIIYKLANPYLQVKSSESYLKELLNSIKNI